MGAFVVLTILAILMFISLLKLKLLKESVLLNVPLKSIRSSIVKLHAPGDVISTPSRAMKSKNTKPSNGKIETATFVFQKIRAPVI